ncbi:shikimate dehydrogenase [bacterium]|nr:shikimate dehydrogenase [bacterium]
MSRPHITSRTRTFGVIGDPVEHSLSPVLHNFVLERLGLDARYMAFHVKRELGPQVGSALRTLGLSGLNVTLPHKEAAAAQAEVLSREAAAVGAVNTLGLDPEGRLAGHNTDVAGFLGALQLRGLKEPLEGQSALVLGAGGAARAILYGLGLAGVRQISLANRTLAKADELLRWFLPHFSSVRVRSFGLGETAKLEEALAAAQLTVNVTPLGMKPHVEDSPLPEALTPREGSVVFDTIYNPEPTLLLERAEMAGCTCVGGLDMLIIQGMESLGWWLGETVPWRGMLWELRELLREALDERD